MKILVIGGYGNFGKRLVLSLIEYYDHHIIIAGRSKVKAAHFQQEIQHQFGKHVEILQLDVFSDELSVDIINLTPDLVVNASGPYQFQTDHHGYSVAKACLLTACHYVDLADNRQFVAEFNAELSESAEKRGVTFVTGASTVPALSCAVIDHYSSQFSDITELNYGISPGNKTERGTGTIGSILSYTGKKFTRLVDGKQQAVYGWQGLRRFNFGSPLGVRWMSHCNIPDLELLPKRYPQLKNIQFQAGLEVSVLHLGLWFLSFFTRLKIIKNLDRYTTALTWMSEWFKHFGSDSGGMFVELKGRDKKQQLQQVSWQLTATNRLGPNIPTIAAEIVIHKIEQGLLPIGAMPCMGLFSLDEFFEIAKRWGITQEETIQKPRSEGK